MMKKILLLITFASTLLYAQSAFDLNSKYALAQSYLQGGQYEKAKSLLEDLYAEQPANYQFFQSLNDVYVQLKDYDSSINLIESWIKKSNPDINLYGMLGKTYYIKGDENKAFEIWDNALKTLPQSEVNYRVIANYAIERRAFDKAIEYLKKGQDISSNPIFFAYDLANLYSVTMQYKNATEEYCMILSQSPGQAGLVEGRILNFIGKPGALEQAISIVEKYAQSDNINFKELLAKLYSEAKDYDKAFKLYQKIDEIQNSQGSQLLNFAQFLYDEKIYKTSAEVYNDVINKFPNSPFIPNAKLGYAKTLEAVLFENENKDSSDWKPYYNPVSADVSEADKVVNAYLQIVKLYNHSETANEALLRIGEIKLFKQNDITESKQYFEQIVKDSPLSQYAGKAYLDLGEAELINGNLVKATEYFSHVISNLTYQQNDKNTASYKLARIYFYKGDFETAKNALSPLLNNLQNSSANDALELSLLMNTSQSDSSNLTLFALAEKLAGERKFAEAFKRYESVASDPQKFMLQNLAALRGAEMQLAMSNYDTSIVLLQKIASDKDANIYADKALYLLGEIYQFGLKDSVKAIESYEDLLARFPNSLYLDEARAAIIKLKNKLS
jgi:tetratricopeptide (TPR) repeat protein